MRFYCRKPTACFEKADAIKRRVTLKKDNTSLSVFMYAWFICSSRDRKGPFYCSCWKPNTSNRTLCKLEMLEWKGSL